jgi:replication fork protection complex subunit Csm3/Swi3
MPSKTSSKPAEPRRPAFEDVDSYLLEDDYLGDPFRSPSPDAANKDKSKPTDILGIDEEVEVKKRARAPRVKLDENRSTPFITRK